MLFNGKTILLSTNVLFVLISQKELGFDKVPQNKNDELFEFVILCKFKINFTSSIVFWIPHQYQFSTCKDKHPM